MVEGIFYVILLCP